MKGKHRNVKPPNQGGKVISGDLPNYSCQVMLLRNARSVEEGTALFFSANRCLEQLIDTARTDARPETRHKPAEHLPPRPTVLGQNYGQDANVEAAELSTTETRKDPITGASA
jgi:hypothetical protein